MQPDKILIILQTLLIRFGNVTCTLNRFIGCQFLLYLISLFPTKLNHNQFSQS